MFRSWAERLDLAIIQCAAQRLRAGGRKEGAALPDSRPDWRRELAEEIDIAAAQPRFSGHSFSFDSPVTTPWPENNRVPGKFFPAPQSRRRGSALLVHGWNGETGYEFLFPILARWWNRRGLSVAMFELPVHGRRKPKSPPRRRNFLTPDAAHLHESVRQSVAEIQALTQWLREIGHGPVAVLGVSLGAWLAGLAAAGRSRPDCLALFIPVIAMHEVIERLPFCEGLRDLAKQGSLPPDALDLAARSLALSPENVLVLASRYDLFSPLEEVERLKRAWPGIAFAAVPHGHISAMLSPWVWARTGAWIAERLGKVQAQTA